MKKNTKGIIAAIISVALLSTYSGFGKILLENLSPHSLAAFAQAISVVSLLLVFGCILEYKKLKKLPLKDIGVLILVAFFSAVLAPILLLKGLQDTSATSSVLIGRLEPVIAGMISAVWLKEKITLQQIIGALIMFSGISIIVTKLCTEQMQFNGGDTFIILSAFSWAFATNLFKKYLDHLSPELVVLIRNLVGSIVLLIIVPILMHIQHDNLFTTFNPTLVLLLILFSIFVIIVPQYLWYRCLELIPASKASSIGLSGPLFGVLFAIAVLHETLSLYHFVGGVFILIGLSLTVFHHQKHKKHHVHMKLIHWVHH